jgi:hypothetical protein
LDGTSKIARVPIFDILVLPSQPVTPIQFLSAAFYNIENLSPFAIEELRVHEDQTSCAQAVNFNFRLDITVLIMTLSPLITVLPAMSFCHPATSILTIAISVPRKLI